MAKVFVSYAHADHELADSIRTWLAAEGHDVFLDVSPENGLTVGEAWERELFGRLRWADAVVFVVTTAFARSVWCSAEIGVARGWGSRLLPLLCEPGVDHPLLRSRQGLDYATDPAGARAEAVIQLRRLDAAGGPGWPDDRSPFPGLRPFGADLHRVFFGRAEDTRALVDLLRSPAGRRDPGITLVVGSSGCGKSSLLRAGVCPAIAASPGWVVVAPFEPDADPVASLARVCTQAARAAGLDWTAEETHSRIATGRGRGLAGVAQDLLGAGPAGSSRLLLAVDQFEELLTVADPAAKAAFAAGLRAALAGPVSVVATVRPEFLAAVEADPDLAGVTSRTPFTVKPLRSEALATVITEPARMAGIGIDPQLTALLVDDTGGGDALPLLAFTLAQLAEGVHRGGRLSLDAYRRLGGVRGALTGQAQAALDEASAGRGRDAVLATLLWLVTTDEQNLPVRQRIARDDLSDAEYADLEPFLTRRLLVTSREGTSRVTIGLAHEAFVSAWRPLAQLVEAERLALRARRAVEQAAGEWAAQGRPPAQLWERSQLAAALASTGADQEHTRRRWPWPRHRGGTRPVVLGADARAFLRASVRRDRRRRRRSTSVLATLLVLALTAAGIAQAERSQADGRGARAMSRMFAAELPQDHTGDPRVSMMLALAAWRSAPTAEARSALLTEQAIAYQGPLTTPATDKAPLFSAAISHDNRLIATGGQDGTIRLFDAVTRRQLGAPMKANGSVHRLAFTPDGRDLISGAITTRDPIQVWSLTARKATAWPEPGGSLALSPDGRTLALFEPDRAIHLWDVATRRQIGLLGPATPGRSIDLTLAFSPDATMLASGGNDGTVQLWHLPDRRLVASHTEDASAVNGVAFSPDGTQLATGGLDQTIRIWDAHTGDAVHTLATGTPINTVGYTPNGHDLLAGGNHLLLWEARSLTFDGALLGDPTGVFALAVSPDGHSVVTTDLDGTAVLWSFLRSSEQMSDTFLPGEALSPDGHTLAVAVTDGTIHLWNPRTGDDTGTLHVPGGPLVLGVDYSPDGRTIASTGSDGHVRLLNAATGQQYADLPTDTCPPGTPGRTIAGVVHFSPDGRTLAVVTYAAEPTVSMAEAATCHDRIRLWDAHTLHALPLPPTDGSDDLSDVVFTPDSTMLIGTDGTKLRLWRLPTRSTPSGPSTVADLPTTTGVGTVTLSPDGRLLAAGGDDGTVDLWDLPTRRLLGTMPMNATIIVRDLAFSPDGRTLAAVDAGGALTLWTTTKRTVFATLQLDSDPLREAVFTPDGRSVITTNEKGRVVRWDLNTDTAYQSICSALRGPWLTKAWKNLAGAPSNLRRTPPC